MSDSVDRVFVHALNTVKKIPRTGSARPPLEARMKLYGLYKQSMEGDVEGVMERPGAEGEGEGVEGEGIKAEREKWDAWAAQKGLSRTEAKRRYISTLIETMHDYASTTPEARELVSELEFVWDQIKDNPPSSSDSSSPLHLHQQGGTGTSGTEGSYYPLGASGGGESNYRGGAGDRGGDEEERGLRQLSPVSTDEEEEQREEEEDEEEAEGEEGGEEFVDASQYAEEAERQILPHPAAAGGGLLSNSQQPPKSTPPKQIQDHRRWRRRIESALVKMTTEIAALREQLEAQSYNLTGSGVRRKRSRWFSWVAWMVSSAVKLVVADLLVLGLLLLWMRRKGDVWLETLVVGWLRRAKRRVRSVEAGRVVGEQVGRIGLAGRTALGIGRGGGG